MAHWGGKGGPLKLSTGSSSFVRLARYSPSRSPSKQLEQYFIFSPSLAILLQSAPQHLVLGLPPPQSVVWYKKKGPRGPQNQWPPSRNLFTAEIEEVGSNIPPNRLPSNPPQNRFPPASRANTLLWREWVWRDPTVTGWLWFCECRSARRLPLHSTAQYRPPREQWAVLTVFTRPRALRPPINDPQPVGCSIPAR
jgi:hypothetical protein